jgi:hypothetical protein
MLLIGVGRCETCTRPKGKPMMAFAVSFMASIVVAIPVGASAGVISEPVPLTPPDQPLATECPEPDPAGPVTVEAEVRGADCHDLNNVMPWGSEIPMGEPPVICEPEETTVESCSTFAR